MSTRRRWPRSRRWTDFEEYLISRTTWAAEREQHYAALGLPIDNDAYLTQRATLVGLAPAPPGRRLTLPLPSPQPQSSAAYVSPLFKQA